MLNDLLITQGQKEIFTVYMFFLLENVCLYIVCTVYKYNLILSRTASIIMYVNYVLLLLYILFHMNGLSLGFNM